MRRIVVAVDLSDASRRALEAAAGLAKDLKAQLVLVHAYTAPPRPAGLIDTPAPDDPADEARSQIALDEAVELSTWADDLRADGLSVETDARDGPPVDVILDAVERHEAGLIVCGTQGLSGIKRFVLGSVAEDLVRKSRRPVLVVPPAA